MFSMRDNFQSDDNHLYTMNLVDRRLQQITFSPTVAGKPLPCSDTEPCFAPNGEIVFQSTRCGQLDVCWAHPTANLYACDVQRPVYPPSGVGPGADALPASLGRRPDHLYPLGIQ